MGLFTPLAALLCIVATVLLVVRLVNILLLMRRRQLPFKQAFSLALRQSDAKPALVAVWAVVVLASLLVVLFTSGNIRHMLGSRALAHLPVGRYAYLVEVWDRAADAYTIYPAQIDVSPTAADPNLKTWEGTAVSEDGRSYLLAGIYRGPGDVVEFARLPQISPNGTLFVPIDDTTAGVRLLDEVATWPGFAPVFRRTFFYWLDLLLPVPVLVYLAWLVLLLRRRIAWGRTGR
ncbi:hypothetical protein LJC04_00230 [Ruminococcaceae bacterium OttesenSCG-928-O06]|nr:hypothetical protein [Ruminococcaceae bacterium OttesenSCG-928-O06]